MQMFLRIAAVLLVVVGLVQALSSAPVSASAPGLRLSGGADSVDELLQRFLAALRENDSKKLRALRVTEREYRELVVPGNVKPGDPPQILSGEASEYFWQQMNQKSAYHETSLLDRHAGRTYTIEGYSFEKGHKRYAGHQAWRRLALDVKNENGGAGQIRTGSIIERDGRYKFVSFIRD